MANNPLPNNIVLKPANKAIVRVRFEYTSLSERQSSSDTNFLHILF